MSPNFILNRTSLASTFARGFAVVIALAWMTFGFASVAIAQSRSNAPQESLLGKAIQNRESSNLTSALKENIQQTLGGSKLEDKEGAASDELASKILGGPDAWLSPKGLSNSLQILLLLTVLSLAPAILLMTTCYVRIIVVFGLLKQALGAQQLPPSQVITSISLFITIFVMTPVWTRVYNDAIEPYTQEGSSMSATEAWERGVAPVRDFMARQIDMADNHDDVHLFYSRYAPDSPGPKSFDDVPLQVLLPAYMLSELKTAFLMGFKIYLPFLILDIVIASVTVSMGMMMLPPALISTPFKLLLFVLVDGWRLVVLMLLESFGTFH
jgi:flagellar biosynthesis protein FliP